MNLWLLVSLYFIPCIRLVVGLNKNVIDEEITQLNYTIKKSIIGTGGGDQDFLWKVNLTDMKLGSYQIKVVTLSLDSSSGDFVLIKASPLILTGEPGEDKIDKIPSGPGIFLSDNNPVDLSDIINIVAPNGSLIYFHFHDPPSTKGKRNTQNATIELHLSKIVYEIDDDDDSTGRPIPTDPPLDILRHFIQKNLTGITPNDFVNSLNRFKSIISNVTNEYRVNKEISDIPVSSQDVWIPLKEGVHFCTTSTGKSEVKQCVNVKFGLLAKDPATEKIIYTNDILKDIWITYKDRLAEFGYREKDELTNRRDEQIGIWIWVTTTLGILLLCSAIVCTVWMRNINNTQAENPGFEPVSEGGGSSISGTIVEQKNPIYGLIGKMIAKKEEQQKAYRELSQTNLAFEDENVEFDITNLNSIKESWRNFQSRPSIVSTSGMTETST